MSGMTEVSTLVPAKFSLTTRFFASCTISRPAVQLAIFGPKTLAVFAWLEKSVRCTSTFESCRINLYAWSRTPKPQIVLFRRFIGLMPSIHIIVGDAALLIEILGIPVVDAAMRQVVEGVCSEQDGIADTGIVVTHEEVERGKSVLNEEIPPDRV